MDEQFDNKLTNHIRKVFDDYEHPGAEHGWAQLKNRFPVEEKGRKTTWLWWSSAAAVILVFLGIGLWYNKQVAAVNNMAVKPAAKTQQPAIVKNKPAINSANNSTLLIGKEPVIAKNSSSPAFNNSAALPLSVKRGPTASATEITDDQLSNSITNKWVGHPQPWQLPANALAKTNTAITNDNKPVIDSQKVNNNITTQPQIANTQPVAVNDAAQLAAVNSTQNANSPSTKKSMTDMFNDDKVRPLAKQNDPDKQENKKVNFSIYAATYFNYAEGSTNQINAGAGFTSDFKLSKNLKLSTGIALAQNSLNYNNAAPQAAKGEVFAAAPPLKQASLFAAAALVPVFKNYNASLVGLDIPINIKYEFNPQKTDAYILAGVSSGTFIDESYTYRYNYSNGTSIAPNSQTEQTAHNSFNSFYFAKTLNLSFGVGYPLGKNRLIVEPFVKYPLGGLGAQDIRFGAGGVNLKFSFKGKK
ncbi:outer membrane beta-barrel protein [Mucilaginibacter sp. AK015]|uniref:outer membrane beta-barrel protein n=1 Tax=Mucilaginibacter sp. AK015 TaxID=2723072 RepID=UPI00160884AE|nr:outer membrane beta-barrel protein [Mucilaginibacter sp. AK015]MBB5395544.1 hypothetical protein [Mucilaginibacter sp. AK015]